MTPMRTLRFLTALTMALLLSACVSSLLVGNQLQSRLMWAFIEPLVGFNPNEINFFEAPLRCHAILHQGRFEINFFEAPLVKDRMTTLLGDKYEPAMRLLRTANQIQQEGALYYVASRYAPQEARDLADSAGLVWNADTNQMAVLLVRDGVPDLLAEQAQTAATQRIEPLLPAELKSVYDRALAARAAVATEVEEAADAQPGESADPLLDLIRQRNL